MSDTTMRLVLAMAALACFAGAVLCLLLMVWMLIEAVHKLKVRLDKLELQSLGGCAFYG